MTHDIFKKWLAEMKAAGLAKSDAECARMLGIHVNTLLSYKDNGASQAIALACRALLHRMTPYS